MKYFPKHKNLTPFPLKTLSYLLVPTLLAPLPLSFASNTLDSFDPSSVDWKLYHQKGSIKIFEAKKYHSSGLVPLKISTLLDHPLEKAYSVLVDYSRRTEWVPRLKKTYIFKKIHPGRYLAYSLYDSPWPFKDRSVLVDIADTYNRRDQTVTSTITSVSHPELPHQNSDIRFDTKGTIVLKEMDGGKKTYAELVLLNDFKGNIPKWLVNFVQRRWPHKMLEHIKIQLNKKNIKIVPIP